MALQELVFKYETNNKESIPKEWSHTGVTGSGDMEVILSHKDFGGKVEAKVVTPVKGFDEIWNKVIKKFVDDNSLGNLQIEINDNNSTPFIASTRLKQALIEARGGGA